MLVIVRRYGGGVDVVDHAELEPCHFDIRVIARALSFINRFAGMTPYPISVARHSMNVMREVSRETNSPYMALRALLHDAEEAFTGDVLSPWKKEAGVVSVIGDEIRARMGSAWGVQGLAPIFASIHNADLRVREQEFASSFGPCPEDLLGGLAGLSPAEDEALFLKEFYTLYAFVVMEDLTRVHGGDEPEKEEATDPHLDITEIFDSMAMDFQE